VPVVVPEATVARLWDAIEADPATPITVDVRRLRLEAPGAGVDEAFPMDPSIQHRYLEGLDDIGITLVHAAAIDAFEVSRPSWMQSKRN
jgi:3-isopropylmalate/(R)-2-methylmalate dehydratase small subunit